MALRVTVRLIMEGRTFRPNMDQREEVKEELRAYYGPGSFFRLVRQFLRDETSQGILALHEGWTVEAVRNPWGGKHTVSYLGETAPAPDSWGGAA